LPTILVPDLSQRAVLREKMDDFTITTDQRLGRALRELRIVNLLLGGARAVRLELEPVFRRRCGGTLHVLDVGTGLADIPKRIVQWGERRGVTVTVTAVDANPATVAFATESLNAGMDDSMRDRIDVRVEDVFDLGNTPDGYFDVAIASLFLHHFYGDDLIRAVGEMKRVASLGLIINDLHRHSLAYAAIRAIANLMPVSDIFMHDGPASVKRGFRIDELHKIAADVDLRDARIRRRWAYRLVLSTLPE
jgi:2-polyprenyl-3-methyl-5-hydroxy-6-metoxy-1,4-benzoquinol methylase